MSLVFFLGFVALNCIGLIHAPLQLYLGVLTGVVIHFTTLGCKSTDRWLHRLSLSATCILLAFTYVLLAFAIGAFIGNWIGADLKKLVDKYR